jgi:hypothetical protein
MFGYALVRISDAVDGTSNTFLIGERHRCRTPGWILTGMKGTDTAPAADVPTAILQYRPPIYSSATSPVFSSRRWIHFALADGSVRLSTRASTATYQAGTRNRGEAGGSKSTELAAASTSAGAHVDSGTWLGASRLPFAVYRMNQINLLDSLTEHLFPVCDC